MSYAYRDQYGILHVVTEEQTAKEFVGEGGKIVQYFGQCAGGYPVTLTREPISDYGDGDVYLGGTRDTGIKLEDLPEEKQVEVMEILERIGL